MACLGVVADLLLQHASNRAHLHDVPAVLADVPVWRLYAGTVVGVWVFTLAGWVCGTPAWAWPVPRGSLAPSWSVGCSRMLLEVMGQEPGAEAQGIDPDADILSIAREKARRAGVAIALDVGFADELPHGDASFDHVVSTLAFHHLTPEEKDAALREAMRVLKPGGGLHIGDFGRPARILRPLMVPLVSIGAARAADNLSGRLPELVREAGFTELRETARFPTLFAVPICLLHALKPR